MEKTLYKVLLIEDNPGDARLMREYLAGSTNPYFALEVADRLGKGLERLERGDFDAVIVDLCLPDAQGFETFLAVRTRAPTVPIVVLTGIDDEMLAEKAVREGAQDYLVKGRIDAAQLGRAIRYAIARQQAASPRTTGRQGKTVSFIGAKGGVGTTTLAVNVATAWARKGFAVTLVELRSSPGTLAHQLHATPVGNLRHLLELEPAGITPEELATRMSKLPSGLRVLFGPQTVEEYGEIAPEHARAIVRSLARDTHYVVLDLPCEASPGNRVAIEGCDFAVLAVEPEPLCLKAGKTVVQLLEAWGLSRLLIGAVVVNRGLWGSGVHAREIRAELGCEVVGMIPPGVEAVRSAMQTGLPLILSRPESNPAAALNDLALRLIQSPVPALAA